MTQAAGRGDGQNPSNLEILAYEETPLGPLCLRRRSLLSRPGTVITEATLDHEFLMSSLYTESETALATLALDLHGGAGLRVLVGGLGLGYTAHAALQSDRVADVLVLELFPEVVDWLKQGLLPLSEILMGDERLRTGVADFFQRMAEPPTETFNLILVDIDHAPDQLLDQGTAAFYSEDGLRAVRAHLAPDGVLAVWSSATSPSFVEALRAAYTDVRTEPITFHQSPGGRGNNRLDLSGPLAPCLFWVSHLRSSKTRPSHREPERAPRGLPRHRARTGCASRIPA